MPNSGTVTAGSAALASQYNNLRDDVLNTSTGHTHTGASENGAQIEGTVIKSTGATSGYVLTAGSGGTATTWSALPSGGGALTFPNAQSAAFATAAVADQTAVKYTSVQRNGYGMFVAVFHGGTNIAIMQNGSATASTYNFGLTTINLDNTTSIFNSTISVGAGGTTVTSIAGDSRAAGTAFAQVWSGALSTTYQARITKLNKNGTQVWQTTLHSFTTNGSAVNMYTGYYYYGVRYAAAPDIWYLADQIGLNSAVGTAALAAGTARVSRVWIVNNTSGSAYSAAFSSASTNAGYNGVSSIVFVPDNVGTPTGGTIHAWGYEENKARYCTYAVTGTSITAVSTANAAGTGVYGSIYPWLYPNTMGYVTFRDGKIMTLSGGFYAWDRTGGTLLHAYSRPHNLEVYENGYASPDECYDSVNGVLAGGPYYDFTRNNSTLYKTGSLDESFVPTARWLYSGGNGFDVTSYPGVVCGAGGTATHWFWCSADGGTAGSLRYASLPALAKVPLDTAGSGNRMYTGIETSTGRGNMVALQSNGTASVMQIRRFVSNQEFYMYDQLITSGGSAFVWVSPTAPVRVGTAAITYWDSPQGTAWVKSTKISLA